MASFEWIDADRRFRLALRPRPGPDLDREMTKWRSEGVDRIVSLQTIDESARMGLAAEPQAAVRAGLAFERFAIPDHDVPRDRTAAFNFARQVHGHLLGGQSVVLHCYAGIGRSGLMAVLILMIDGYAVEDARLRASLARGIPVPETEAQLDWLDSVSGGFSPVRDPLA